MTRHKFATALLLGASLAAILNTSVLAENFNIPSGDLDSALDAYTVQSGVPVIVSNAAVKGLRTGGVKGDLDPSAALARLLRGTGFIQTKDSAGVIQIVRRTSEFQRSEDFGQIQLAQAAAQVKAVETVTVTSSKLGGADVQSIPISITALSQEQLTATQTAGGPDLIKQVPNMTFTKTNFSGYSIQLRGIGTQAISVTTDPAVAVAFNDMPFIRNHFFEQEFYDVAQVEVLRGPQGTLYGRNATAGVVNLASAKPTDQFEAMATGEIGSYHQRRFETMINFPIVDDRVDLRIAGEWTKRQGYSFNSLTDQRTDGRDLWSGRVTLGIKPSEKVQTYLIWEHFSEDDDRMRTSKQLCKTSPNPESINGVPVEGHYVGVDIYDPISYVSQGCERSSLYSSEAFEVPNGYSIPYASGVGAADLGVRTLFDPYASTTQSKNMRVIESTLDPIYKAKNDTVEFNTDIKVTPSLTLTSQTGYNHDFLWSTEDYNRFNTRPGMFQYKQDPNGFQRDVILPDPSGLHVCKKTLNPSGSCIGIPIGSPCDPSAPNADASCEIAGYFCDPQVGCSDRLVAQDLNDEKSWQLSQELRLSSNFSGPFNFSVGGNYLHYETEENYYVFINTLTTYTAFTGGGSSGGDPLLQQEWVPGVSDNSQCIPGGFVLVNPFKVHDPQSSGCSYIDPNPISSLNNQGHNYFLSQNPYVLNSYAAFGETYYNVLSDLKLIGGLRWTRDDKHFVDIPSEVLVPGYGYPITGVIDQKWSELTGRLAVNWTPKLDFTDQTMIYGSYAHGYKAGGANPPGAILLTVESGDISNPVHPATFKPEFIDAFELGSKNTLLDGALTLNTSAFYYNYENYQISRIVDRTSINDNFDAHVKGVEIESTWEPMPGFRLNFAGGWEDTALAKGSKSVDLMDRTAGNPNWIVIKPFITQASNCVVPNYVAAASLYDAFYSLVNVCGDAYNRHFDPLTSLPYTESPTTTLNQFTDVNNQLVGYVLPTGYPGFDPLAGTPGDAYTGQNTYNGVDYGPAPNNGEGFYKDLSGHKLPNAPPLTISAGAQYTTPLSADWAGTARVDYYWQDYSWARVFNDNPYDRLRGYTSVNLTMIFTSQNGWQVMLYDKNVFNTTAITGTFLNSDDSGLTTNVFLTDPKLIGVRVSKNW